MLLLLVVSHRFGLPSPLYLLYRACKHPVISESSNRRTTVMHHATCARVRRSSRRVPLRHGWTLAFPTRDGLVFGCVASVSRVDGGARGNHTAQHSGDFEKYGVALRLHRRDNMSLERGPAIGPRAVFRGTRHILIAAIRLPVGGRRGRSRQGHGSHVPPETFSLDLAHLLAATTQPAPSRDAPPARHESRLPRRGRRRCRGCLTRPLPLVTIVGRQRLEQVGQIC